MTLLISKPCRRAWAGLFPALALLAGCAQAPAPGLQPISAPRHPVLQTALVSAGAAAAAVGRALDDGGIHPAMAEEAEVALLVLEADVILALPHLPGMTGEAAAHLAGLGAVAGICLRQVRAMAPAVPGERPSVSLLLAARFGCHAPLLLAAAA